MTHTILELPGRPPIEKEGPKSYEDRALALDPMTLALMAAQHEHAAALGTACQTNLIDDPFLFSNSPDGSRPWRPGGITQYFARLRKRVDLPNLKFEQLRAFMDTYGQELGFSIAQVALRAGHDPAVAAKHYTGRVSEADRELAAALASLLTSDTQNGG